MIHYFAEKKAKIRAKSRKSSFCLAEIDFFDSPILTIIWRCFGGSQPSLRDCRYLHWSTVFYPQFSFTFTFLHHIEVPPFSNEHPTEWPTYEFILSTWTRVE